MMRWNVFSLIVLLGMASPAAAAVNAPNAVSEFTYYKIGIFFTLGEKPATEQQGFHLHGQIPNKFNLIGIEKFKYEPQYDLTVGKLTGVFEIAQTEVP